MSISLAFRSFACSALLLVAIGARAQEAPRSSLQTEEERVLATEDEYVAAEVSRDEATLRRILDDRFVFNSSRGTTSGKEEFINNVMNLNMTGQTITERSVLIEGDVTLVFGTAELRFATSDSTESVSLLRYTSTYVNRGGNWRMLALQMQKRASD